jgi:hypothetical protein
LIPVVKIDSGCFIIISPCNWRGFVVLEALRWFAPIVVFSGGAEFSGWDVAVADHIEGVQISHWFFIELSESLQVGGGWFTFA